jgi:hypothetical protein
MALEERVAALEAAVRKLGEVVQADIASLHITNAEVARQSRRAGWSRSLDGRR